MDSRRLMVGVFVALFVVGLVVSSVAAWRFGDWWGFALNLGGASLHSSSLQNAEFDEDTKLPDETIWTPDTDMARFTDPNHPDFWRSDDPNSPAYRGKDGD
jgi:hypothetical protein